MRGHAARQQGLDALCIGFGNLKCCLGAGNLRLPRLDRGFGRALALFRIGERCLLAVERGQRLIQLLLIAAAVDLEKEVALLHGLIVVHIDLGDVTGDLRADNGHLTADIGIVGRLDAVLERRQLPRPQYHQDTCKADDEGETAANILFSN